MKKVCLGLFILVLLFQSAIVNGQVSESDRVEIIRADPDWQILATSQDLIIKTFVSSGIDIEKFDFSNETLFLKTINMTKEEYLNKVGLAKESAKRLIAKYGFKGTSCSLCSLSANDQIRSIKSQLIFLRNSPDEYSRFRQEALGVQRGIASTVSSACCGFWFYACCTLCAASIEAFPVYLMCCAYCFHSECCKTR
jgi:hypothetical protein